MTQMIQQKVMRRKEMKNERLKTTRLKKCYQEEINREWWPKKEKKDEEHDRDG